MNSQLGAQFYMSGTPHNVTIIEAMQGDATAHVGE